MGLPVGEVSRKLWHQHTLGPAAYAADRICTYVFCDADRRQYFRRDRRPDDGDRDRQSKDAYRFYPLRPAKRARTLYLYPLCVVLVCLYAKHVFWLCCKRDRSDTDARPKIDTADRNVRYIRDDRAAGDRISAVD